MTTRLLHFLQKVRAPLLVCAVAGLVLGTATSQPVAEKRDTVDTNPGPFAVVEQGANVMLALSVEFPTVGLAYRTSFEEAKNYLGYWDYTGCYKYRNSGATDALQGNYFYRTGSWNAARECNYDGRTGEYSGNLLNYVASSAIDILRLGLTGGHRELDTTDSTVLSRAYLYKDWSWTNGYTPLRTIPGKHLGKLMPAAPAGVSIGDNVYAVNCQNKIWFGSKNEGQFNGCIAPKLGSQDLTLDDYEAEVAVRSREGIRITDGCSVCSRERMIAGFDQKGDSITFKNVRVPTPGDYDLYIRYGHDRINNPRITYQVGSQTAQTVSLPRTPGFWEPRRLGKIANVHFSDTVQDVKLMIYGSNNTEANNNAFNIDVLYRPVAKDATPPAYYGQVTPDFGYLYARVKVCDTSERTTRTDLCQRYPSGNYKPVGEIQKNAQNARIGAFGYLDINGHQVRYGGVMRAPLSYIGPSMTNASGIDVANPNAEWDSNTGVFIADPRTGYITPGVKDGATGGFPYSGAINYLNRFGTLNPSNLGYYKGNDPLGEMYYENIRYFMGKQPADAAISGVDSVSTNGAAGGFPFYKVWQDPITNQCQKKNFILTIGDVYTWEDSRFSLGVENGVNPVNSMQTIAGYEGITNLSSLYYNGITVGKRLEWAGAAWAANTGKIRNDFDKVRVRTFAIDVDENGDGKIDGNKRHNPKPRQSSMYLAGKYGWFVGANPQPQAGEWDSKESGIPDGYVIASQAEKLLQGIKDFFAAVPKETASIQSSAISSQMFNSVKKEAAVYVPSMNPVNWSGSLVSKKMTYNPVDGSIGMAAATIWDAGSILTSGKFDDGTAAVAWGERKVFTMSREASKRGGQAFSVANKGNLDAAVLTALGTKPGSSPTVADGYADARIQFILGDRSNEMSAGGGMFRARASLMGDVVFSGPVYKKAPDAIVGKGYATFAGQTSVKNRRPAVYVGANDGMLHAFDAGNGKELFAYIPRAVAEKLNHLTNPNYAHTQFVDGVPNVGEAQIFDTHDAHGSDGVWKTVLVSGMGGGAQGVFALDVTTPESFAKENVMFEFTDQDDADMGNIMGKPRIVKMQQDFGSGKYATRWYVAVGSGYNNYAEDGHASVTGVQSLFLLSLDKKPGENWQEGTNYYKIKVQEPPAVTASSKQAVGMSSPAVVENNYGNAITFYAGDLSGQLWKFNFENGISTAHASSAVKVSSGSKMPLATFKDASGKAQPITSAPLVYSAVRKGHIVMVGTGKFMEAGDAGSTAGTQQAIYGIWDDGSNDDDNYAVTRGKLKERTFDSNNKTDSTPFEYGTGLGKYRGWVVNLKETRERVMAEGTLGVEYAYYSAVLPSSDECAGGGTGSTMAIDPVTGSSMRILQNAFPGQVFIVWLDDSAGSYSYGTRSSTGKRIFKLKQVVKVRLADGTSKDAAHSEDVSIPAGRVSWREIRQFLD